MREEVPWLHQLKSALDREANKLPIIARDSLSGLVAQYVTNTLSTIELRMPASSEEVAGQAMPASSAAGKAGRAKGVD